MTASPRKVGPADLWPGLSRRQMAELAVPGAVIGLLGGVIAGGLAAAGGLSLPLVVLAVVALAVPLAAAGGGYDLLLAQGKLPMGPLTPVALYWLVAFPVARVVHALIVNLGAGDPVAVPHGWLDFIAYNILLGTGFAIGFWWLHQNIAPRWWYKLRHRNPIAGLFITQLKYLFMMQEDRRQRREARKAAARRRRSSTS